MDLFSQLLPTNTHHIYIGLLAYCVYIKRFFCHQRSPNHRTAASWRSTNSCPCHWKSAGMCYFRIIESMKATGGTDLLLSISKMPTNAAGLVNVALWGTPPQLSWITSGANIQLRAKQGETQLSLWWSIRIHQITWDKDNHTLTQIDHNRIWSHVMQDIQLPRLVTRSTHSSTHNHYYSNPQSSIKHSQAHVSNHLKPKLSLSVIYHSPYKTTWPPFNPP